MITKKCRYRKYAQIYFESTNGTTQGHNLKTYYEKTKL